MKCASRRGQTMVEYVLTFCALLVALGAIGYFMRATRHSVVRSERLVASDYP
ncbi:MAG: hypothetical protein IJI54_03150 [Kiritimatiellae bacterium]|nr:hypothetical protein [Kiritimatiellia bacterium]